MNQEPRRVLGVEKVGDFTIEIVAGEPSPEAQRRWDGRVDTLTAWLLAEWKAEQEHNRNEEGRSD